MLDKIKVLLVDDHQLVLNGIIDALSNLDYIEVDAENNCQSAYNRLLEEQYDILFTDLSFDNALNSDLIKEGQSLIRKLKEINNPIKIGVITGHTEPNRVYSVIKNQQPLAYLLKTQCTSTELEFAIQKMMKNERYFSFDVQEILSKRNAVEIAMDDIAIQILTQLPNHPKISNLEGKIKKEDGTPIKLRTIESKLSNLRIDLGANNNTDLVLKAKNLGIID